ncbi:isopentenyl-diphosphate Delta-isomerase [Microbacterium oleivorans]|uniref:isopentenyl-diphosphate Delta-isomerase n=1 Tax=Microbacterium oleivorans TaxID=273677 RepID=UPI00080E0F3E|nr:isopentenyl-diphosphate Delta-isomerase [Microbacterium oleivorans]
MPDIEYVVLMDDDGRDIGTAPKATVHGTDTPLHFAFSCHVYNARGQILVTRRALSKAAWPGVWTNSFCGHPGPGEAVVDAVHRRAAHEVGLVIRDVTPTVPDFRYRAVDASGIVENEICPVYVAYADEDPILNPDEVAEARWVDPADLAASVSAAPWAFSPWLVLQAQQFDLADPVTVRRAS